MKIYSGDYAQEIAFPLSGIGTGGVSISGIGRLIDWELDGRANKGSCNEYTHFAIKAERGGKVIDARVLHGDMTTGVYGTALASHHHSWGYGQGPNRTTLAGLAHFSDVSFAGEFPFAKLSYKHEKMPADISLEAFNPFIPIDEDNSSLPAASFKWKLRNTSDEPTDYTIAFSVGNPFRISKGGYAEYKKNNKLSSITLKCRDIPRENNEYGELAVATDCDDVSYQEYWYRSGWFDDVTTFWSEFSSYGKFKNRHYDDNDRHGQLDIGDMCTLAVHVSLMPNEEKTVKFYLTWYFPHFVKYWDSKKPVWNHEYVRRFSSSADVLEYYSKNYNLLYEKSDLFRRALCEMTLPDSCREAAAANLCVLKSPTCLRLENGEFWAFEGTNAYDGSCEGTCDHVWNYQYALPLLFPDFARQIIETDYTYNMKESGEMMFRTMLPLGSYMSNFRACVDVQMGCILRFYREWKFSGDDEWLKKLWPRVKKSLEYAWSPDNRDRWDPDKSGVISGRQHHTLDMELFGPNSWLTGFYLAALKAGAEIAEYLGEKENAEEYMSIFRKGQLYLEKNLFNGKHYIQKIDLKDKSVLDSFAENDKNVYGYWNSETDEMKYQIGEGCIIDQMLAQWHANLIGLGDIFDRGNCKTACETLYKNNFKSMRDVFNPCRIFALNDESGMVICTWEDNVYKPRIPIPYTEECMTGFEYAAAGLMIQNGFVGEGIKVIDAIRDRYDGRKRNPFSEIECGASYARSMASFSLPAIFSGFTFYKRINQFGFNPITDEYPFKSFWSFGDCWGTVCVEKEKLEINVCDGMLKLDSLKVPVFAKGVTEAYADGRTVDFYYDDMNICFRETAEASSKLEVIFGH